MNLLRHLPNALTCGNLLCGCLGLLEVFPHQFLPGAAIFMFIAAVLDFFDGFVARLLKVSSPIGKELDSLADVVTFGVLPAAMWFTALQQSTGLSEKQALIAFGIAVFSALRLAKFNIDTRQGDQFIGLPTPANALLFASICVSLEAVGTDAASGLIARAVGNPAVAVGFTGLMCYLLVAELPLFALKFKHFGWAGNQVRYIFLLLAAVLLFLLKFAGVPLIIFLYIGLSAAARFRQRPTP